MLTSAACYTVARATVASQSPMVLAAVSRRLLSGSRSLRSAQPAGNQPHVFEEPHISMHAGPRRALDDELSRNEMAEAKLHSVYAQLRHNLESGAQMTDPLESMVKASHLSLHDSLDNMAAAAFTEASVFPEFTPGEDVLTGEAQRLDAEAHPRPAEVTRAAAEAQLDLHESLDDMVAAAFSEASVFPEYTPIEDFVVVETQRHDAEEASTRPPLPEVTRAAAEQQLDLQMSLDDTAADAFTESSMFPEYTPVEDVMVGETQRHDSEVLRELHRIRRMAALEAAKKFESAQAEIVDGMGSFCAAADFPECSAVQEIMEMRE
jgi:hypothetical protein